MIYLFDKLERLINTLDESLLISWVHQLEVNQYEQASFEVPVTVSLAGVKYFGFFHEDQTFKLFRITEIERDEVCYVKGIDKAESDLRHIKIIQDKRPQNVTAEQALYVALEDTGYQVGEVSGLPEVLSTNFYYIPPSEALVKIIETWRCEFRVRYTFVQNKITSRYIDLSKRFGKVSGKQFVYGDNALSVVHEESEDEVVTALIGRGRGEQIGEAGEELANGKIKESDAFGRRIEFTDVVWSRAKGDPVDKPKGQNYLLLESARPDYGLSQNGVLKHRWAVWIDEQTEDPAVLIQRTWEALNKLSVPLSVFRASVIDLNGEASYGDSVAVIRDEIGIAFQARIFKMTIDKLNANRSSVELGDYEVLRSRQNASNPVQELQQEQSLLAQQLTAYYRKLEEDMARKNAEIAEELRLAQLEFEHADQLAKVEAEAFQQKIRSEIEFLDSQATAMAMDIKQQDTKTAQLLKDVGATRDLAQLAKSVADKGKSDLEKAVTDLTKIKADATSLLADVNGVKRTVNGFETTVSRLGDRIETKADLTFVNTLSGTVATHDTKITQAVNELSSKVSKSVVDSLTGRVSTAESTLTQHADSLKKQLTSSQVETLITNKGYQTASQVNTAITGKGYQTKAQVDSNITGRGYITNAALSNYVTATTFNNYQNETSQAIERGLTATKSLIPTEFSGNILKDGLQQWRNSRGATYTLDDELDAGRDYTLSIRYWNGTGGQAVSTNLFGDWVVGSYDRSIDAWVIRGKTPSKLAKGTTFQIHAHPDKGLGNASWATLVKGTMALSRYQEPVGNLVTQTDFNRVKETATLYERVIGKTEGDVQTNLARQVMTSQLYQTEVKNPLNNVASRVTQLADSYGVKVLTDSSKVLAELNLNSGGVKIQGKLIHLNGQTLIDNGVIKSAMIDSLDAGKISTGFLDAKRIGANVITSNHLATNAVTATTIASGAITADKIAAGSITSAKIATAGLTADLIRGGYLTSRNGNTQFNLDAGNLFFNHNDTGVFRMQNNASTMGLLFQNTGTTVNGTSRILSRAILGSERRGDNLATKWQEGGFNGVVIDTILGVETSAIETADRVSLVGDRVRFTHTYDREGSGESQQATGWEMKTYMPMEPHPGTVVLRPTNIPQQKSIIYAGDMRLAINANTEYSLKNALVQLAAMWRHLSNVNGNTKDTNFQARVNELFSKHIL